MDNVAIRGTDCEEGILPGEKHVNRPGVEGLKAADPERIGGYRLLGRLGEGGMGTVYLALAPTGRAVALKVVKAEFAVEDGFAARFHSEVENARRVASFCTAQVLDNGNGDDGRPYMVTEYIAGTPLSRQISEHGALEPGTLHGVALGVAAALAAIHISGLVHRDLKPSNVILSMSGPRVIDFGIARALDATHNFTRSGELLGTPGWWAPEQLQGHQVTPAADIFAWGCLVAYAGNGRHPYGRGDLMTMAARLLNGRPDLGALPAPLNDLVSRATAMDPQLRPTAQDLLIALVGGGIAAPAPAMADPPTLIADDLLHESWRPPPNVEPDSARTLGALNLGTRSPAQDRPEPATVPPAPPSTSPSHPVPVHVREQVSGLRIPAQPDVPDAGKAPPRRRWLFAGLAVLAALTVTVVVLVNLLGGETGGLGGSRAGNAGDTRETGGVAGTGDTDVGRRMTTGLFEDPQLIIPRTPVCELTTYRGATPVRGRFCAVEWTLINTGGEAVRLSRTPLSLLDDQGTAHTPEEVSTGLPTTLPPGAKADGVLIYDLSPSSRPATLTGTVSEDGGKIQVRLS